jgi:hypothetical protein
MRLSSLVAALACAAPLYAQCPSPGDCRKPHEGTGCEMPECCALVCKANPLCCELAWDQACADAAIELAEIAPALGFHSENKIDPRITEAMDALKPAPNNPGVLKRLADLHRAAGNLRESARFMKRYLKQKAK